MKLTPLRLTAMALITCAVVARAEMVNVVEISDFTKKTSYEIKPVQEYRDLKKTIDAEARVFQKAMEIVKKEWEAGDKGAPPIEKPKPGEKIERPPPPPPFPSGLLAPRKITDKGSFSSHELAQKKLDQLDKAVQDALSKEADRNKGKQLSDKDKKKMAMENERAAAADRAATALATKIEELIKNPPGVGGAASNAAPAAAK